VMGPCAILRLGLAVHGPAEHDHKRLRDGIMQSLVLTALAVRMSRHFRNHNEVFMKASYARTDVLRTVLTALALGAVLAGCASAPREVSPQASASLAPMRDQADHVETQINQTGAAATTLLERPSPELTPQIDALDSEVQKLKQTLSVGRSQVDTADVAAAQYFSNWEEQLKTMSDDLASSGGSRRQEAMTSFGKLRSDIASFGEQARAYVADLDESVRYMRTDKTMAGVKTVTPKIRSALARQPDMLAQLDKVQSEIDKIRGVH
jgi:hypothetical protein